MTGFPEYSLQDEREFALRLGKTKEWYEVGIEHFQSWAERAQIPWRAIEPHLEDTLDKARTLWPQQLTALPMVPEHKKVLIAHWRQLRKEFQIRDRIA